MVNRLRALIISPDIDALQNIKAAFTSITGAELTLRTTCAAAPGDSHDVLVIHAPNDWLRKLRANGYHQPALVLTDDDNPMRATPLDEEVRPVENVTWAVVRAGLLPVCVDIMLSVVSA